MERRELFKNKYRIKSIRYPNYDYSEDAAYFITICTKDRNPWFGEIMNRQMGLSEVGCEVYNCWNEIPKHFPFIILDTFIVMPDHIHGILIINKPVETRHGASLVTNTKYQSQNTRYKIETRHGASLRDSTNRFGPLKPQSLQLVVNQFKGACTRRIRTMNPNFKWQTRFYDRIVRDDREMDNIREYVMYNAIYSEGT
jgi:putative transposase